MFFSTFCFFLTLILTIWIVTVVPKIKFKYKGNSFFGILLLVVFCFSSIALIVAVPAYFSINFIKLLLGK